MVRVFNAKIGVLLSITFPTTLIWLFNLCFKLRGFLCLMVCVLQPNTALTPPEIP
jgi:hypothetical protein